MTTINASELTLNGVEYVRKDSIKEASAPLGPVRIVVADRGWIFVGSCEDHTDGTVTIKNARNIRRWGTTQGLGQLVMGPLPETKHDQYGTVRCAPIAQINVIKGW